jgi:hypothetical protein
MLNHFLFSLGALFLVLIRPNPDSLDAFLAVNYTMTLTPCGR